MLGLWKFKDLRLSRFGDEALMQLGEGGGGGWNVVYECVGGVLLGGPVLKNAGQTKCRAQP